MRRDQRIFLNKIKLLFCLVAFFACLVGAFRLYSAVPVEANAEQVEAKSFDIKKGKAYQPYVEKETTMVADPIIPNCCILNAAW